MSKIRERRTIKVPTAVEDREIIAAAKADPDAQPLTIKQLRAMVPLHTLSKLPKSESPKQVVSISYSQEVLAYFKATGNGWQSRMDGVLREYVARQSRIK